MSTRINVIGILSLLIVGCNVNDAPDPRSIVNGKYDNKTIGISLQFPTGWILKTDQKIGNTTADLVATSVPINGLAPNVNVIVSSHTGSSDMNLILPQIRSQLQSTFPDLANYSDTSFVINGTPIGKIKYAATTSGHLFKFMQVFVINKSKDIIITYTDDADHFDLNQDIVSVDASMSIY